MKLGISSGLLAHYGGKTTTVAMCWKVTLSNETVYGFTAHDADIVFDGLTYEARSGFLPSASESQSRLAVDNLQMNGVLDSEAISVADVTAGLWDFAAVDIFLVNWADLGMGREILMRGRLGEVTLERNRFVAELRGLAAAYAPPIGEVYQITCRASLGDARCGVDLTRSSDFDSSSNSDDLPYQAEGMLDAVSESGLVLTDAGRDEPGPTGGIAITGITRATLPVVTATAHGFPVGKIVYIAGVTGMVQVNGRFYVVLTTPSVDTFTIGGVDSTEWDAYVSGGTVTPQGDAGHWDYGKMTMLSGASIGLTMEVKAYSPGTITLQLQFPRGVAPGDEYIIEVGCGKRFAEDCVGRFNNGLNFRGEPHLPGMDQVLRVGGQ